MSNSKTQTFSELQAGPERLVRLPEAKALTGLGRTSIYMGMKEGTFPSAVKIGRRSIAWPLSTLQTWIHQRVTDAEAQ